ACTSGDRPEHGVDPRRRAPAGRHAEHGAPDRRRPPLSEPRRPRRPGHPHAAGARAPRRPGDGRALSAGTSMVRWIVALAVGVGATTAAAAGEAGPELGAVLPVWSAVPFAGMLLSIALLPLLAPTFWHHHFPKVSAAWSLAVVVPFVLAYGEPAVHELLHVAI